MRTVTNYIITGHPLNRLRTHYALHARTRIFELFLRVLRPTPESSVLDLGVTADRGLAESNFFEKLYPYTNRLVAAGMDDASWLEIEYPGLSFLRLKPGPLPFADDQFDILFCSAVLEHVGDRRAQEAFVRECLRVSRSFFLTTPDRRFPMDFHTFLPLAHWLPQPAHQAILRAVGMDFYSRTENLNLLYPDQVVALFPPCRRLELESYRLFGIPSNIIVYGTK